MAFITDFFVYLCKNFLLYTYKKHAFLQKIKTSKIMQIIGRQREIEELSRLEL